MRGLAIRGGRGRRAISHAALVALLWTGLPALAADPDAEPARDAAPPRAVSLDTLLKLPTGTSATREPRVGGVGRAEWAERFRAARADLTQAEERLAQAQQKLESLASGAQGWQVTAPGAPAGSESGPLSYGLRQEIRRQREEVERAQRTLDDLRVEANLAGVPEAWQDAPTEAEARDDAPTQAEARDGAPIQRQGAAPPAP